MKKGNIYEGTVTQAQFGGKGIVDVCEEDRVSKVIVKGTVPGQKIQFRLTKKKNSKLEGKVVEILEKSPLEDRQSPCPHFGQCGGCSFQNISYENQLELKSQIINNILDEAIDYTYDYEGIIGSPDEFYYRNKMEYSFGDEYKDGPLSLGMHKKESFYDIVTTDNCMIVNDDYNKILTTVLDFAKESGLGYFHKITHIGYFRHLLVRRSATTGEITVNLVTTSQNDIDFSALKDNLLALELEGNVVGITHIINDSVADAVKCDKMEVIYGRDYVVENIMGLCFKVSTFSFFQTNSRGAERLYEKAREYIGTTENKIIFDLYSGTGTIAQVLAPVANKVVGVEIVEEAVEAAKINSESNGLNNCYFIAGDVLKVLDDLEEKPDLIVLDPPRDGIHPKALKRIIDYSVDRMVYISCKPTSLARDLEVLQASGYRVERACAVDMFAQNANVETVCLLSKLHEAKHHVNV